MCFSNKTNYPFRKPICFIWFLLNCCTKTNKTNKTNVFKRLGMGGIPHGLKTFVLLVLFVFMQQFKGKPMKHIGFLKEYLVFFEKPIIPLEILGFLKLHESFTIP